MSSKDTIIKIDDSKIGRESQKTEINILCLNLTPYSQLTQFLCCCIFVFICYLGYGLFLEMIFSEPAVKPVSLYITLVQFIITVVLSYVESLIRNPIKRKVPIRTYALLAALTLGTMSLSNLALSYLNYPTQLIFKSCKLIPVMIGSIIILGKRYGFLDYVAAVVMCIGLTMFTLAESQISPNFDIIGVIVISLALLCDAIIGNVQEKAMKQFQASNNEVVFYSYAIGCVYLVLITGSTGILHKGFIYCSEVEYPRTMYLNIFLLSLSGYLGLQAVLTLVRISGATVAVTVTTMRKALSIIISFLLFSKPFVFQYQGSAAGARLAAEHRDSDAAFTRFVSRRGRLPLATQIKVLTLVRISGATVAVSVTTMRKALSIIISFLLFSKPFVFQYVWSGLLVALAIYLNHYSKKNPGYVPAIVLACLHYTQSFYQSEYRYLRIKTKIYADTV